MIALGYAAFGIAWILLSDRVLPLIVGDVSVSRLTYLQSLKGLFYIAITAGFIYLMTRLAAKAVDASVSDLAQLASGYQQLFDKTGAVILIVNHETQSVADANPAAERFYGWSRSELNGKPMSDIEVVGTPVDSLDIATTGERPFSVVRHRLASGDTRDVAVNSTIITSASQTLEFLLIHDLTERRLLENQLRQAQKMEAVGQLTGGIAHDLNNILTVVLADADLIAHELIGYRGDVRSDLDDLRSAARRGASMIRKLLSFSRNANLNLMTADMGALIQGVVPTLRLLLPENIQIEVRDKGAGPVRVDPVALEQIVLNLATNARDAMNFGGTLVLETGRTTLAPTQAQPWLRPGTYLYLRIADTGIGMDERTQAKVFEPFFTTKAPSEGAGLGMAMIYGLVKQHGGFVVVESKPGEGTTVSVYFSPAPEGAEIRPVPGQGVQDNQGQGETILLVEDEDDLRRAGQRILERLGYHVFAAQDGQRALEILDQNAESIDLVISDVVMPKIDGRQLYETVRARKSTIRFLFTSGYAQVGPGEESPLPDVPFIQKPWTLDELGRKVREVLDSNRK
ncbi:MAG: ATP-binding protein [Gemmatimonadota bacterium]